jgi:hypothetical protein|tara:strand:+ start:772 stop:897 length:126 start_codon:yes stop_codon:yes gene_type:complete
MVDFLEELPDCKVFVRQKVRYRVDRETGDTLVLSSAGDVVF